MQSMLAARKRCRSQANRAERQQGAEPRKHIAMRGVEGDVVAEAELGGEGVGLVARDALADASVGVYDAGDAVVGVAQDPAAILDGAHAGHIEVLPGGAGVAVPAVVADVDENFCAERGELANFVGEDGFIADEDAVAVMLAVRAGEKKDFVHVAASELGDAAGEFLGEEEELLEWNVFAEGDQVDFVVAANGGAIGGKDQGGVVVVAKALIGGGIRTDAADNHRSLLGGGYRLDCLTKTRIVFFERCGGFGPYNQV